LKLSKASAPLGWREFIINQIVTTSYYSKCPVLPCHALSGPNQLLVVCNRLELPRRPLEMNVVAAARKEIRLRGGRKKRKEEKIRERQREG
jgi:hypothetical protein